MFTRVWSGNPYPLGATWDGSGVNFALFSENATQVELCLFDSAEARAESVRIALASVTNQVWHCYLPDARPGQCWSAKRSTSTPTASGGPPFWRRPDNQRGLSRSLN